MKNLKKLVQKILSWPWVKQPLLKANYFLLWFGSLNRLTSSIYSILFFLPFSREQHAVTKGKYLFYRNLKRPSVTRSQLRRNIHRLEKGMIMQPRRDIFASGYILDTVKTYQTAAKQFADGLSPIDEEELAWAQNVFEKYFEMMKPGNKNIEAARSLFESIPYQTQDQTARTPYASASRQNFNIKYEDFLALTVHRRSVRWFLKKKVEHRKIDNALLAARQSPSACNRLPYEFRIFDEPELVQKVASLPFGAGGYSHNIPTIAVVVGKLENYLSARDRHAIYIDSSLAAMSFMLALETQGVSTSVINWPDFEPLEMKMKKLLGLEVSDRPVMLIAIGYADPEGRIPFSQKKQLRTIRTYNKIRHSKRSGE